MEEIGSSLKEDISKICFSLLRLPAPTLFLQLKIGSGLGLVSPTLSLTLSNFSLVFRFLINKPQIRFNGADSKYLPTSILHTQCSAVALVAVSWHLRMMLHKIGVKLKFSGQVSVAHSVHLDQVPGPATPCYNFPHAAMTISQSLS